MPSSTQPQRVRPRALQPGDTIGIIAPAGPIESDALDAGCATLLRLGYRPFYLPSILDRDLYFAGSAAERTPRDVSQKGSARYSLCARRLWLQLSVAAPRPGTRAAESQDFRGL